MRSGLFWIWHQKAWAVLVGGYIFSHKIRLRPRLLKQFVPKKIIEEIKLYDHKVICQDVSLKDSRANR